MSFYTGPDSHIRDKVVVVWDLSNYVPKKINNATRVNTSNLAFKKILLIQRLRLTN